MQILHREPRQVGQPVQRGHATADVFRRRSQHVAGRMETVRRQYHLLPERRHVVSIYHWGARNPIFRLWPQLLD